MRPNAAGAGLQSQMRGHPTREPGFLILENDYDGADRPGDALEIVVERD
jgi:hypothetical protein